MSAPRILIIEDEPSVADSISYALATEGYEPVWKPTGQEGLRALEQSDPIQLAILDVGLPDLSGFEVCKAIRQVSDMPILFLTARSDEIDRVLGLELGGDDYVTKPFSPRELAARVRAILRRTAASSGSPDDSRKDSFPFERDEERMVIRYDGEALDLTRYEYNLLAVLMDHPGRVYSRAMLMDLAWDEPDASMERTVDAHIKSLRAKLKRIRSEPDAIITHRGIGYSMQEAW